MNITNNDWNQALNCLFKPEAVASFLKNPSLMSESEISMTHDEMSLIAQEDIENSNSKTIGRQLPSFPSLQSCPAINQ